MQPNGQPIIQDLVLIGGGHSHAIALKQLGMHPVAGVQITLISDLANTPYSGMLPGYVAGLYSYDDCHIDLYPLSQLAQVRLVRDRAVGLDLAQNRVLLANHPPIAFDYLSIDIGSTPATITVPGAKEHTIPVKPISHFLRIWDDLVAKIQQHPQPLRLAIVGGGAGGVELALAIQARLQLIYRAAQQPDSSLELHLFHQGDRLLPERSAWVGHRVQQILAERGIQVHLRASVASVDVASVDEDEAIGPKKRISCTSGFTVCCDHIFWVTGASAALWVKQSGLATDEQGFIQVNDSLQSISHAQVFAAGDIATIVSQPRPKAGVFAVRQGLPLVKNLRRVLQGQRPRPFKPQKNFLILIGTGDEQAIASRGFLGLGPYRWLWRWKDQIDRRFMQKFTHLKPMMVAAESSSQNSSSQNSSGQPHPAPPIPKMHCAGCGSKVGSAVLEQALTRIQSGVTDRPDILIGLNTPDDAAVITFPTGQAIVQTIDSFRALVEDPFVFGQICAHHCLSDIFAMGAVPHSALAIATLPYAAAAKQAELLYQLLSGATQVLQQAGAPLIGGHTTEATELAFGLTCNGVVLPDQLWRKSGIHPGQGLILTKALGTGTLFAAQQQLKAKGEWIETAIASMLCSNQAAAACLRDYGITACTDVTGFGLLGHLLEMVQASQVRVELDLDAISILKGAQQTTAEGIFSSLYPQNLKVSRWVAADEAAIAHPIYPLLFDPQTSGGLLAAVPLAQATACLETLHNLGYPQSRLIGVAVEKSRSLEMQPIALRTKLQSG